MKSALIVFETAFRYGWQGSASRIHDFTRELTGRGWECTLLASKSEDETQGPGPEDALCGNIIRTPFSGVYPDCVRGLFSRKLYRTILSMSGQGWRYQDPECAWPGRATDWYVKNHKRRPDVVLGMTTGSVGNLVAARQLAEEFRVPLVLEFQDPCPSVEMKTVHPSESRSLRRSMLAADLVLTTTRDLTRDMESRFPECSCRFETLYMTYDAFEPPVIIDTSPDKIVILHAGSLAGGAGRNVRVVVKALARAVEKEPALTGRIQLELLGGGIGGKEASSLAVSLGVGELVRILPSVSRDEALARMRQSNILLLVKYADPKYAMQIPGKLFQYLGQGLPILGVMPTATEAAEILQASGLGVVFNNTDIEGIASFLLGMSTGRFDPLTQFNADWDYIQSFSVEAFGRKLDDLLSSVCAEVTDRSLR